MPGPEIFLDVVRIDQSAFGGGSNLSIWGNLLYRS